MFVVPSNLVMTKKARDQQCVIYIKRPILAVVGNNSNVKLIY